MQIQQKEKKVEYLELIYDLIFVYIIGRNNSLLHHIDGGFITGGAFLAYFMCTLAVIQIWNYSTFYINIFGRNGVRDHVFLFVNMFLLYYMANGTVIQWQSSVYRYSVPWAMILINLGLQYIIEMKNHKSEPWVTHQLSINALILFIEAALVGVHIFVFSITGVSVPYVPIFFGMAAMIIYGIAGSVVPVDFAHLAERAMLYVVFTFGEMIISAASYFTDEISFNSIYFALMAFLIAAGLFLSYGTMYNKIIDKESVTNGLGYMTVHIFLIFALNNISVALEFMRNEDVELMPKTVFLTGSFVMYFTFMFLLARYAKRKCAFTIRTLLILVISAVCFIGLMILLRENMYLNIALSVIYIYAVYAMIYRQAKLNSD